LPELVLAARAAHPEAELLVHPECLSAVVQLADHALSTGGMLRHVRQSEKQEFIIGTESGILHRMRKENPGKRFYTVAPEPLCPNMKKICLEDVLYALRNLEPRIELDADTMSRARIPIERMLAIKS
jgi:quinolinate synthase